MGANFSLDDEKWMKRALRLSERGRGTVEPNPMVGCVIVSRGRCIGEGYHRRFGGAHAEVEALRRCERSPRGATAYVTLEPCCHYGKTGPCTKALLAAGIGRVVAAMPDPFVEVAGKGFRILRRAGVRVEVGVCRGEAEALNASYLKIRRERVPWVILKWAQSLDGRIATRTGDSKWISCEASREIVHRIRGCVDAVLVGVGTVLADDPSLTCRAGRAKRVACRVVLDTTLRTPPSSQVVRTAMLVPTLIAASASVVAREAAKAGRLRRFGVEVAGFPVRGGHVDIAAVLKELGRRDMSNVLVEGGGEVAGSMMDAGVVDELIVFVSPRVIGGQAARYAVGGRGVAAVRDAVLLSGAECRRVGTDWMCRARLRKA